MLHQDPFIQFQAWHQAATDAGELDPDATALATSTPCGKPSVRIVLLKGIAEGEFRFYTHYESRKGEELASNPYAAITSYWRLSYRQVRIEGRIEKLTAAESQHYFSTRPRASQIGAWASPQDQIIVSRADLLDRYAHFETLFENKLVPCPAGWGGYRFIPLQYEFWQGQEHRLHERFLYLPVNQEKPGSGWVISLIAP